MAKRVGVGYSDVHDQSHLCGQVGGGHAHGVINQAICCYKAASGHLRCESAQTQDLGALVWVEGRHAHAYVDIN